MIIVGVDEAGRGPLAGPVVAACVLLGTTIPQCLDDSKKLSEEKREQLFFEISNTAQAVGIGIINADEIDNINILRASHLAMKNAILQVHERYPIELALIDGSYIIKDLSYIKQRSLIKGDTLEKSIMAASIMAKVHRDRLMINFDKTYPEYGFKYHKGYGTYMHIEAIMKHGPCPIHRKTFAPIKNL